MGRISHWTPHRWSLPVREGGESRADCVFALVQRLADATAEAEAAEPRRVPRLENDLALPDQLRVMIADLVAVSPPTAVCQQATVLVEEVARLL